MHRPLQRGSPLLCSFAVFLDRGECYNEIVAAIAAMICIEITIIPSNVSSMYLEADMLTADLTLQWLHEELAEIQAANLTMNDRFLAEAALISRALLLDLMHKHQCALEDITATHIAAELKQRAPMTYSVPAIPEITGG